MHTEPVDPRDTTWELREPVYRVYFWSVPDDASRAATSYEWRIADAADVHEVIAWAEAERGNRSYELFVEHVERVQSREGLVEAPGLIRLAGTNPTDGPPFLITFHST